jgi:hypothetical protein
LKRPKAFSWPVLHMSLRGVQRWTLGQEGCPVGPCVSRKIAALPLLLIGQRQLMWPDGPLGSRAADRDSASATVARADVIARVAIVFHTSCTHVRYGILRRAVVHQRRVITHPRLLSTTLQQLRHWSSPTCSVGRRSIRGRRTQIASLKSLQAEIPFSADRPT